MLPHQIGSDSQVGSQGNRQAFRDKRDGNADAVHYQRWDVDPVRVIFSQPGSPMTSQRSVRLTRCRPSIITRQ
jgi:hypothetical protein